MVSLRLALMAPHHAAAIVLGGFHYLCRAKTWCPHNTGGQMEGWILLTSDWPKYDAPLITSKRTLIFLRRSTYYMRRNHVKTFISHVCRWGYTNDAQENKRWNSRKQWIYFCCGCCIFPLLKRCVSAHPYINFNSTIQQVAFICI